MSASTLRVERLLRTTIVWDNHGCMPLRPDDLFLPQLRRYLNAGVTVVSLNVGFADISWVDHLRVLSFMRRWIAMHAEQYRLISSVDEIQSCKEEGKLGVVFDIEGMCPVQEEPALIQTFYELGVRWMLIAYNRNNDAGGGCQDLDCGLTTVGQAIIREMERVGMVLCLSHAGLRTVTEALEFSRNPAIFSHSNPHGVTPHKRNISNEAIRACARKGGVVGLSGIGPFLGSNVDLVNHLMRQLRYVIDLVGPEYVGLGLDYVFDRAELDEYVKENPSIFPPGMMIDGQMGMVEPESIHDIAEGLARSNLTDEQIRGVLGGNWFRVARQVWR